MVASFHYFMLQEFPNRKSKVLMITMNFRELQGLNDVEYVKVPCRGDQKHLFAHVPILLCLTLIHMAQIFTCVSCQLCNEAAKSLQSCPTLSDSVRPHRWQPTRLPHPWDSPGKNTGVGCYFLLQCMKVKSESEVAQWCLTLSEPMDCSLLGSSIHGIFQARVLEWGAIAFSIQ